MTEVVLKNSRFLIGLSTDASVLEKYTYRKRESKQSLNINNVGCEYLLFSTSAV